MKIILSILLVLQITHVYAETIVLSENTPNKAEVMSNALTPEINANMCDSTIMSGKEAFLKAAANDPSGTFEKVARARCKRAAANKGPDYLPEWLGGTKKENIAANESPEPMVTTSQPKKTSEDTKIRRDITFGSEAPSKIRRDVIYGK